MRSLCLKSVTVDDAAAARALRALLVDLAATEQGLAHTADLGLVPRLLGVDIRPLVDFGDGRGLHVELLLGIGCGLPDPRGRVGERSSRTVCDSPRRRQRTREAGASRPSSRARATASERLCASSLA